MTIVDNEALHREEALMDRVELLEEQLGRAERKLSSAESELERISLDSGGGGGGSGWDPRRQAELEQQCARLREERTELYRAQSSNTQRLLDLNEQLKERDTRVTQLETDLRSLQAERAKWEQRQADHVNLLAEKNLNIQIMQDELTALQLELLQSDDKLKALREEMLGRVNVDSARALMLEPPSELIQVFPFFPDFLHEFPEAICAHGGSRRVAMASPGCGIVVGEAGSRTSESQTHLKIDGVSTMAMDDKLLLAAHPDGLTLFSLATGRIRASLLPRPAQPIRSLQLEGEQAWLIDGRGVLRVWHLERLLLMRSLEGPYQSLSVAGKQGIVLLREGGSLLELWPLDLSGDKPMAQRKWPGVLAIYPATGPEVIVVDQVGIHVLKVPTLNTLLTIACGPTGQVIAFDDLLAAIVGEEDQGAVCVWRRWQPEEEAAYLSSESLMKIVRVMAHDRTLLTIQRDGSIGVWK